MREECWPARLPERERGSTVRLRRRVLPSAPGVKAGNVDLLDLPMSEKEGLFEYRHSRGSALHRGSRLLLCCLFLPVLLLGVEPALLTPHLPEGDHGGSPDSRVAGLPAGSRHVTVTAYTNVPQCTDSTPDETASLLHIKPKHYWKLIALSRDLAAGHKFGDRFLLKVNGWSYPVEFQDLMAARHRNKIDFLLPSVGKCMRFGVKEGVLIPVGNSAKPSVRSAG